MNDIERARAKREAAQLAAEAELPHVVARVVCPACGHGGEGTSVFSVHPVCTGPAVLECQRCHALGLVVTELVWCDGCQTYLDPGTACAHAPPAPS